MTRIRRWTAGMMVAAATAVLAQAASAQAPAAPVAPDTTTPAAAPASGAVAPAPEKARPPRRPRRSHNRIDAEELAAQAAAYPDAYALVNALRPSWLRVRPGSITRPEEVKVYRDGGPAGGVGALRYIQTHTIGEIQYLSGIEATQRYGTDHGSGVILVRTRS